MYDNNFVISFSSKIDNSFCFSSGIVDGNLVFIIYSLENFQLQNLLFIMLYAFGGLLSNMGKPLLSLFFIKAVHFQRISKIHVQGAILNILELTILICQLDLNVL